MVDWLRMVFFFEWFWQQELTELTQIIPPITSNDHQEISRAWQPFWLFSWRIYDSLATSNLCLCGPSSRTPFLQTSTESNQKNRIYVDVVFSNGFTWVFDMIRYSGWWFGTWLLFFHILGKIIPTDELIFLYIFHRGKYTTNQIRYLFTRLFWYHDPATDSLIDFLGFFTGTRSSWHCTGFGRILWRSSALSKIAVEHCWRNACAREKDAREETRRC